LTCLTRISKALPDVREERTRTAAEKDAFERFAERVSHLETTRQTKPPATVLVPTVGSWNSGSEDTNLEEVRKAYRQTVMVTDHYEEEYDESLATNVAAEFGPDYTTALVSSEKLTPPLQKAIVQASYNSAQKRSNFLQTLDNELEALVSARRWLREKYEDTDRIQKRDFESHSFDELVRAQEQLEDLKNDCEAMVEERRTNLANQPEHNEMTLREYLYTEYEWSFPIIGDTVEFLSQVYQVEQKVVKTVIRRR
jgi:hypothetical protein